MSGSRLRRGEVLAIAISVVGTVRPGEATWFKITRIEAMGQRLFGRKLFSHPQYDAADLEEYPHARSSSGRRQLCRCWPSRAGR